MGQSLAIPRVIPNDWKRLDLIVNKIKMRLGRDSSPTFTQLTLSKTCTIAAGLNVLRVTGLQTDATALTGTLRGAYIDVSNGALDATGTIRAMELKARTEAPGDTGNDVAVLEGLSISADSKGHSVTTMRAAEFILDGKTGGTITEAVGLRIANNLQANKATTSYGLQIYRDSFDYTADIQLSSGGLIGGATGQLKINSNGHVILQPSVDSVTTFQVLDADTGLAGFTVDTVNHRVGVQTREGPATRFHVAGDFGVMPPNITSAIAAFTANSDAGDDARIALIGGTNSGVCGFWFGDKDNANAGAVNYVNRTTATIEYMTFNVNVAERMRIWASGNVNIGATTLPKVKLQLEGAFGLKELAAAVDDVAGIAQIYAKNDAPNTLWFVNDVGTEVRIAPQDLQVTASPTFVGLTLSGKVTSGSFASPVDVTNTRQYGFELHYSGNDYDVTGIRSRARLKTTDTTASAQGALLQAANEDGIDAGVLNGALIEAIGKSDGNAATIAVMRGCLINTEWGDYDTVTNLKTLHVRTHSRNATGAGSFGTGYGIYIENEAVGGNGQAYDAGIYFKGTNLSAGNKAFTYGIDFSGGTYGTSQINLIAGGSISMAGTQVIKFDATNFNVLLGCDAFANDGGQYNIGIGYQAGFNNTSTGTRNMYIGYHAGYSSTTQDYNTCIGYKAGEANEDSWNVFIGASAGYQANSFGNTFIGSFTGELITSAGFNTFIGSFAGGATTEGNRNAFIGYGSGGNNTLGYGNLFIGVSAGLQNTEGYLNTILGRIACRYNVLGNKNTIYGAYAAHGANNQSHSDNTILGSYAGYLISTGSDNVFLGYEAGYRQTSLGNRLIIDNQDRGSAAAEITDALIYGVFSATPASQTLRFNVGSVSLGNPTHSDAAGGGATQLKFLRQDGAGTETACFQFEASHDGVVANDQLGKGIWSVNTGSGLVEAMRIDSNGTLKTSFGRIHNTTRLTGNTVLDATYHQVFCDTDGGAFTVTLPAGIAGTEYRIINTGSSANNLTIAPDGAELLIGVNANWTLFDGESLLMVYETTEGWF